MTPALMEFANRTLNSGLVVPGYGHAVLCQTDPQHSCQLPITVPCQDQPITTRSFCCECQHLLNGHPAIIIHQVTVIDYFVVIDAEHTNSRKKFRLHVMVLCQSLLAV